jgi:hypothetical protein
VPVAAFPVTGPIDVLEDGVTGAMDHDLARAARRALALDPAAGRSAALKWSWQNSTREFEANLVACRVGATVAISRKGGTVERTGQAVSV